MSRILLSLCLVAAGARVAGAQSSEVDELLRRQTQELYDAVAIGKVSVWDHYLAGDARYTSEDGQVLSKQQLLEQTKPLPPGVSGSIRVVDFQTTRHGSVVIATYVADENENYHGHPLHCQYRSTDTWIESREGWRVIGSQTIALRTDPPPMTLDPHRLEEYAGRYALTDSMVYEIQVRDGKLEGIQHGRKPEVVLVEAPDVLFVPGKFRYRKIFLRGSDGRITGFAERREAWQLIWTRLK